ncbi:unnamed protein product [Adineta ricciae]|uniref:Uncharacterized protein n=1 Tax=Adineta ricciae TaxID=249248 RepID=A0A813VLR1_ADIRI|nr:unnamed protein product [Adineta ricciae]
MDPHDTHNYFLHKENFQQLLMYSATKSNTPPRTSQLFIRIISNEAFSHLINRRYLLGRFHLCIYFPLVYQDPWLIVKGKETLRLPHIFINRKRNQNYEFLSRAQARSSLHTSLRTHSID